MVKIDKLDQEIMLDLQKNGRRSYMDLAKMLHVTEGTVRNRLKRLLDQGIIRVTAIPDLEKFGYGFMGIVGIQTRLADLRSVAEQLAKYPNVCYLANVTGQYEFLAIVLTRSSKEFASFMESVIPAIPSISRTETFVTLNIYKGRGNVLETAQLIGGLETAQPKK
jgi:Lrp/AsnC family transcriptional regulator for asnA, asnC and gidA